MVEKSHCVVEIGVLVTVVFFMPLQISGIETPSGVTLRAVSGSDFVIISWDYQADVTYYRILFRDLKSNNAPNEAGPMEMYCLPDNTSCSYCVPNINSGVSCSTLNRHYGVSIASELDFEQPISVRVEACGDIYPENCLYRSEWKNYTIPPGAPSPVRNVHVRPLSSKTVEVTWSAPNKTRGTIVLYSVLYKAEKSMEMMRLFRNATKGILTGLTAKTKYMIWMTASTANKEGERSLVTTVETYVDECVSSPCEYNGKCHVDGSSFTCTCTSNWHGLTCSNPKGFALEENKCRMDVVDDKSPPLYINVTLGFCADKCKGISSCKSFEYGLGYNSGGKFLNALHKEALGQCKLHRTDTASHQLRPCYFDHYEKKPLVSAGRAVSFPNMVFLGTVVFFSVAMLNTNS